MAGKELRIDVVTLVKITFARLVVRTIKRSLREPVLKLHSGSSDRMQELMDFFRHFLRLVSFGIEPGS